MLPRWATHRPEVGRPNWDDWTMSPGWNKMTYFRLCICRLHVVKTCMIDGIGHRWIGNLASRHTTIQLLGYLKKSERWWGHPSLWHFMESYRVTITRWDKLAARSCMEKSNLYQARSKEVVILTRYPDWIFSFGIRILTLKAGQGQIVFKGTESWDENPST